MFLSSKTQTLYEENVKLCWNFAKGTTAKAQGIMAIAVGALGYFEACTLDQDCGTQSTA